MNWPVVRLGDLGQWFGGGTPSKARADFWTDGTVPWLSPKDMGQDVLSATQDRITEAAVEGSAVRRIPAGSVAVVVRSGILERTVPIAVVPFETTLNQDMKALSPRNGVEPIWVAWALRSIEQRILSDARKAGTTVASIEFPRLLELRIPLPDAEEQRRIVAILEEHLSDIDSAVEGVENCQGRLDALRSKTLQWALDQAAEDDECSALTIGELADVSTGTTPLRSKKDYYDGGTIPWITSGDLSAGLIVEPKQYVTAFALDETSLRVYPPGTLLVAMYGEGKTRGSVAELGIAATINQACAAIQLRNPELLSWVRLVLAANYSAMRALASGGVQPNLNLSLVRGIPVPVPGEPTRGRLLGIQLALDDAAQRLRLELQGAASRARSLRRALLAAAFSGRVAGHKSDTDVISERAGESA